MRIILEEAGGPNWFHEGEREAHCRFGVEAQAREMQGVIAGSLSAGHARFMLGQPFFFLSVREASGAILSRMLACASTQQGVYPLVAFRDAQSFYFLLAKQEQASLLELAQGDGCPAGCIFVDFAQRARLRVNGRLHLADADALPGFQTPEGYQMMALQLEQVYANCSSRIVRLKRLIA